MTGGDSYGPKIIAKANWAAFATACAEGYFKQDSLPQRANNPGDLMLRDRGFGTIQGKTIFTKANPCASLSEAYLDGFAALINQWCLMLSGKSKEYSLDDTFGKVAERWTGGDNPSGWLAVVSEKLCVQSTTTLREFLG